MEASNKFIISIVIPTKNRQEYAIKTVKQVLLSPEPDIQVVIQDNSDDNKLERMLEPLMYDKRLKYNYCPGVLSFVDNFGIAVSHSDGEYICMIGDDDGINHEIVEISRWAKDNNIDAIKPAVNTVYVWPDTGIIANDKKANSGYMTLRKVSSQTKFVETKPELIKLLRNGCQKYLNLELVKLYHGIVRRTKIELVKKETGKYFGGLSPDIYGAVSLSIAISKVLCIDYPLTISGICKKSGSADSATGKHTGKYEDAPHLKGHSNYKWAPEVPKFYSVETIWADSSLAAIKDMKHQNMLKEYKEESLVAYCIYRHGEYSSLVKDHYFRRMKKLKIPRYKAMINLYKSLIIGLGLDFTKRVFNKITRKKGDLIKLYSVNDILHSHEELLKYLKKNNLSIGKVIKNIENEISNK